MKIGGFAGVGAAARKGPPRPRRLARGVLKHPPAMNAIFFAAKRAFWSSVAVTRKMLHAVAPGMTAARYDMMFVIAGTPTKASSFRCNVNLTQSELRRTLGVSAPVVSRMLRSLEELGWVRRARPKYGDQRQRKLTLTDQGLEHLLASFRLVARFAKRLVHRALCGDRHGSRVAQFMAMDGAEAVLNGLRKYCGDTATLWYWWPSPDD